MPLTTDIALLVRAMLTGTGDFQPTAPHSLQFGTSWASGVAASQADLVWGDLARQLAASATEDLDLAGVLAGALGGTVTFARIKGIAVKADPANTNNVVLGGHATAAWVGPFGAAAHTIAIRPGGLFTTVAPDATAWPVTAGTADMLKVANSGAGSVVNYDILVIGASA